MSFRFSIFLSLLRSLFPRWDFFDQIAFSFVVYVKMSSDTEWKRLTFTQPHPSSRLLINPSVNDTLAQSSVVEQFARDVQELPLPLPQASSEQRHPISNKMDLSHLSTFHLLRSILNVKLKNQNSSDKNYQFKIVAQNLTEEIDIYISEKLTLVDV